jgi:hypothetical protein
MLDAKRGCDSQKQKFEAKKMNIGMNFISEEIDLDKSNIYKIK